jgi:hypothetical protein
MTKIGYFFLTRNDHIYYISINDSLYTIIDVYKHVAIEFTPSKPLKPKEIEDFITWMENQDKLVYLHDALKKKLYAIASRVYTYEPRKNKVGKEA